MGGAVAPWTGPARPWGSSGGFKVKLGIYDYPQDARVCFVLGGAVVVVGLAVRFGFRSLASRLVLVGCGAVVAFIPFASWVWLGSSAPSPPPRALVDFMEHLPSFPSADAARHLDTSSRGWGLLLTFAAGVLIVGAAALPRVWRTSRSPVGRPSPVPSG